jgi:hypothetical protein
VGRQAPTSGPPDLSLLKYMPKIYFNYINTVSLNLYTFPSGQMRIENVKEWVFRDSGGRVKGGWNLFLKNIRLGCIYLLD